VRIENDCSHETQASKGLQAIVLLITGLLMGQMAGNIYQWEDVLDENGNKEYFIAEYCRFF
jgi:hypothetical protein